MRLRGTLAGSASVLAILAAGAPAFAQDSASPIETVVVTGIRASEQRALDIKRSSTAIVDAVSAEDIGKFPDKNIADALQRVPGLTAFSQASGEGGFDENDRVAIRGTNPSLTQTTVDGHSVATGDWFILDQFQTVGRSVSFTLFPSEIVKTATVYKSQQADLIEGGVAGTVDIQTHKPLDFPDTLTLQGSAQAVYSDLPDKVQPQINGLVSWHNDAGTFGILAQGFFEKRDLRRDGQEFLGYTGLSLNGPAGNQSVSPCNPTPGKPCILAPTLIGSALFLQKRERTGFDVAAEFRPNDSLDVSVTGFYSHLDADNFNNNFMSWISNEINSNNAIQNPVIKDGTLVSATFPKLDPKGNPVDGVVEDSIYRPGAGSRTWYIDGDVNWRPAADWNIHAKVGYTRGLGLTPTQPTWESDAVTGTSFDMTKGVAAVSFPDIDTTNPGDFHNDWAWSDKFTAVDKEFYTQADAEYALDAGILESIKFGARFAEHNRTVTGFDHGTCFFACPGAPSTLVSSGALYPSDFAAAFKVPGTPTKIWLPDVNKIQQLVTPQTEPFPPESFFWPGSFSVEEKDWAGFVMANFAGNRWKGNIGIRVVRTVEDSGVFVSDNNGTPDNFGNFDLAHVKNNYWDPLPSANLSYDLTDDMVLRAAVARTIARPDFSALGGAVSLNDTILVGTGGNPNLKPVRSWVYDAAWEWYFGPASLLSVNLFYMNLTSFVNFGTHDAVFFNATASGQQGKPVFSTYSITSPANTSGSDKGVEISWQQPLWYGFGIIANYTYADGQDDSGDRIDPATGLPISDELVGDARHNFNLTGYYENEWLSARLAYTYRSKVLVGLDRSTAEHQDSTGSLNASVSVNVTDNAAITFDALNITDETLKYFANNRTQPRAFYDNGRQFFLGLRVKY